MARWVQWSESARISREHHSSLELVGRAGKAARRRARAGSRAAFTLIELVIVIAVIGILAAVAVPRFIDIRTEAYTAQRDGIIGAIRSGITLAAAKNQVATTPAAATFPPNLEATWGGLTGGTQQTLATNCATDPCFELVLSTPVTDTRWSQEDADSYKFNPPVGSAATYNYNNTTGALQ